MHSVHATASGLASAGACKPVSTKEIVGEKRKLRSDTTREKFFHIPSRKSLEADSESD